MKIDNNHNLEIVPNNEQQHINSIIETLRVKMAKDYEKSSMLRDAHPKMHGCAKATFTVQAGLPPELAIGVFKNPQSYPTWVRFSNASTDIKSDIKGDIRGVAIKLMGVEGKKLMPDEPECMNHDFLLISYERFIARDVAEFDGLVKGLAGSFIRLVVFMLTHIKLAFLTFNSLKKMSSVLEIRYFSAVAYLLGKNAVKYSLTPKIPDETSIPKNPDKNYLHEELSKKLIQGDVVFDFSVQLQTNANTEPVEDSTVIWSESHSPFMKVATLTIHKQSIDSHQRQLFGENLSFNPWRCLAVHRPLGGISRARRQVYVALSKFRHKQNNSPKLEPTVNDEEWTLE